MAQRLISQRPFHKDTGSIQSDAEPKREEDGDDNLPFEGGFCIHCTKYKRVKNIHDIKRGDSIRLQRLQGVYFHHAIVEKAVQVPTRDKSCCSLTLIHLQKLAPVAMTGIMATTTEEFDLNKKVIEKVIYKSIRFTPDEIVNRAKTYAVQNPSLRRYPVLTCNCETLATRFAQDVECSSQVITKRDKVISFLFTALNVLYKIISRVARFPGIGPLTSVISLINIIRQVVELTKCWKDKIVCPQCFQKHRNKLRIAFVCGLISLAMSVISHMTWPFIVISLIISVLPFLVPFVHKHIMPLIQPAFHVPKHEISTKQKPKIGDVVTFNYIGLPHEGIVSRVHILDSDETEFKAIIVHFPWPGMFKPYTVTKETLYFKKEDEVHILNFEGVDHLSSEEVVKNALQEVGKQNHSHLTYRSSHMARLCKTGKKSLKKLPMLKVRSYEDLSPGDVIRFKYCGLPHDAVVIQTATTEYVKADVIHYNFNGMFGTRQVVEETFAFNLKDKNTYIHDYKGMEVYEPKEVVRRAESRLGEQKFNTFTNRSSHLAKWCKVKSIPS